MRSPEDRRAFYRVQYAGSGRPAIRAGDLLGAVLDVSERGLRYATEEPPGVATGNGLSAQVRFGDGSTVHVRGMVTRVDGHEVSVRLFSPGLSLGVILNEQRRLRALQRVLTITTPPLITNATR